MKQGARQGVKQGGPSAGEGRHGVGGGPPLRVPATPAEAGKPGRLGTQGGRGHGASPSCSGGGSIGTPGCAAGGSARRPRAGGGGWRPRRGGWLVQPPRQRPKRQRGGEDAGQGGVHAQRAGQPVAHAGRPRRRRIAGMVAQAGEDAGQLRQAAPPARCRRRAGRRPGRPATPGPPTTTTVPMATSSRVSLACWCCSWAQARHWHSGRSGRIATTPLRVCWASRAR